MPCLFTCPKMFCADPNFLSQPHNLTAFSAPSKTFVLVQKPILLNANHLFVWHKKFGPAQNILGPVKGHGISLCQIQVEDSFFVAFSGNINCNHI